MRKNIKERLMPIALTFILLLSAIVIVPHGLIADPFVYPDGVNTKATSLTCGEEILYKVTNDSLDPETDYILKVYNGTEWIELEDGESTKDGDLYITFNAPGWENLGVDPLDTWEISLWDEDADTWMGDSYNYTIEIHNYYYMRLKYDGDWLDYLVYNTTYTPIYMYIYNWTGAKYEIIDDDLLDVDIYQPGMVAPLTDYDDLSTGIWDFDLTSDDLDYRHGQGNLEYYLPVTISDGSHTSIQAIPVILAVTADYPSDAEWGDTITVTGYVRDGQGDGIPDYEVALYCPVNGSYTQVASATTYSTGRYSMSVETGYDNYPDSWSAGNWYIGTINDAITDPDGMRVDESDKYEHPIDPTVEFIRYYMFSVASDDTAVIDIESPDEIIDGFEQTINVTVEWNGEPFDIYAEDEDSADGPAAVHITGIEAWNPDELVEIDEDDYYFVGWTTLNADEDESYCEFNLLFNETGTGTIVVTWPYQGDIYFFDQYNNSDYAPNITGTLDFQVGSAAEMNMVVSDMPDEVMITDELGGTPSASDCWLNETGVAVVTLDIYADEEDDRVNASIHVSGCGLDFTIDEDDEVSDNDHLLTKGDGYYQILINPKMGGTITITATNGTDDMSVSKDFRVSGLTGTVTTSEGNDKEISVESSETITVTVTNGAYSTVKVGYYDEDWNVIDCELYEIEGDGATAGEGLNGIFEFEIEEEDIEEGVGYLVVVAGAASLWMYDIVEVAPVHDLTIEVTEPINWTTNMAFTVGYDHEDWELMIYGPTGEVMDDIDEVYAVLIDEDNDEDHPLQTINFKERSGNRWVPDDNLMPWFPGQLIITAVNNSGVNEHDGNITYDVDYATVTYNPEGLTAGIGLDNITIEIAVVDANGEPMPEGTMIYMNIENDTGDLSIVDASFSLDEGGIGEFEIREVGDLKTWINATLDDTYWGDSDYWEYGNLTAGNLMIEWPIMTLEPDTIFIGQPNTVIITASDYLGDPVEGLNLTLWTGGTSFGTPDPVMSDAAGKVEFSIQPEASGKANVTIVRGIEYVNGMLDWDINESIITDTYLTITSMRAMKISVSKSPIYQGDTLTVTVTSNDVGVSGAAVEFAGTTVQTDATGKATFTAPDPGVESAVYTITAEKTGYVTAEKSITVIKIYVISAITPSTPPNAGEEFTITIIAKGMPLAGATVTFNGKTTMSGGDGKLTLTAPSTAGDYPLTASYGEYEDYSTTITIAEGGGVPGFELFTLIAAIGVAFILLRRRR